MSREDEARALVAFSKLDQFEQGEFVRAFELMAAAETDEEALAHLENCRASILRRRAANEGVST